MNGALSAVGGEAPKEAGSDETLSLIPGTARLPVLRYKFTSFATPVPYEAAEFCVKYFGATALTNRSDFLAHKDLAPEAEVAALRFYYTDNPQYGSYRKEKRFTDVYFVNDPTKASSAVLNVPAFNKYLHDTHRYKLWWSDPAASRTAP